MFVAMKACKHAKERVCYKVKEVLSAFSFPETTVIRNCGLKLLCIVHFAHCFHEVLLHDIVTLIPDGKHTSLCADIS